ncbi:MAG: ABC transporter ATP-binding protein [Phycisphaerae bacterium]
MTADAVIDLRAVHVRAGRRTILGVDALAVGAGEFVAVIGPNGAGKSTLLKMLIGVQRATGSVRVLGRTVGDLTAGDLARLRRRIGYVPQVLAERTELPLTLREVVAIGRTGIAGLGRRLRRDDWRQVDEWLERLGLADLAGQAYSDLSGGEQRKGLIAKAMVQDPEVLLLDEPTANLDLAWRERIVETLEALFRDVPVTVLLVCHDLEVIPACCGRLVLLEGGRITADGTPAQVLTSDRVARLYGAHLEVLHRRGRYVVVPQGGETA